MSVIRDESVYALLALQCVLLTWIRRDGRIGEHGDRLYETECSLIEPCGVEREQL